MLRTQFALRNVLYIWDWRRRTYNSVLVLLGSFALGDTPAHCIDVWLLAEAFLVTIEGCWREGADDR